ncbi:MAG TPA: hypothetical protein VI112_17245 [Bacteroidia bacterium]|jgi:Leucine-rich repeat (LRR) protein
MNVIAELTALESVSFNGCNISSFPADLSKLKRLKHLSLINDPLKSAEKTRIKKALPQCRINF